INYFTYNKLSCRLRTRHRGDVRLFDRLTLRQPHTEPRTLVVPNEQLDRAGMGDNEVADDRESDTGSTHETAPRGVTDSGSVVVYFKHPVVVIRHRLEPDRPLVGCKLEGIGKQIVHYERHLGAIGA